MGVINTVLGVPLGYVIYLAYSALGSYGLAVMVFAVAVKIVVFPVMLMAHRNSIRLLQLQPALHVIKQRHAGDKESINEAQYELFRREKYSPLLGILPLFLQLFLVMGMLQVMYHPLQHMLRMDASTIAAYIESVGATGFAPQLQVIETVPLLDLRFLGLNLGATPSFANPSPELVIILLSGLAALSFCLVQNKISPGALSQSQCTNRGLTIFTVALSLYFAAALPVGVGLYWTVGNFAAIGVVLLLNRLYPPRKLAAEALAHVQANRKTPEQLREERQEKKRLAEWGKRDAARFNAAKKQLVFYALTGGQYKFYKNIIEYLLEHSDIVVHYLTNDPNDAVFKMSNKQIVPYYAGQQKTISLMLKLDTDIFVTTVPDLQTYHMKRSIVRDDIEYIYTFHSSTSTSLIYKEKAFDYFDTVFCVGPHQVAELRRREELAGLPRRKLVKTGYVLYDQLIESYAGIAGDKNERPRILIAPSWQAENIFEVCIDAMIASLVGHGYNIVVRPHPQYMRLFPERMNALAKQHACYAANDEIVFELDFSGNQSIFASDLVITDWSGISNEFSYCTLKPSIFINTPMKIMNPNYEQYGLEVADIALRDKIGVSLEVNDMGKLNDTVSRLLADMGSYKEQINQVVQQYLFHPGRSGEAGGKYIMGRLAKEDASDV